MSRESIVTAWGLEVDLVKCDPPTWPRGQYGDRPIMTSYRVSFRDQIIGIAWSIRIPVGVRWQGRCDSTVADGKIIAARRTREVLIDAMIEAYLAALSRDYRSMTPAQRGELILPSPRKARERAFTKLIHDIGGGTEARKLAAEVRRHREAIGRWLMADADIDERVKHEQSARALAQRKDSKQ